FDPNRIVFVPLSVAQTTLDNARVRGGTYELTQIQAVASSAEDTSAAQEEVYNYLFAAHDIGFVGDEDFAIADAGDVADSLDTITSMLTIFLGMIAGISLLVGGIGIMNIMLVSVTERTKEVGLRKAVGATYGDILTQFLAESVLLSILGGVVGVIIAGVLVAVTSALIDGLTASTSASAVALAVGVSTFIGVFFGAYPASRAANMRPIDALRAD
ncbi:MAG: FtsX-like permease family protein, partial [Chloroflexota bacterium]